MGQKRSRVVSSPIQTATHSSFRGAPFSGANPESRGVVRYHIEIPGSSPSGRALRGVDGDAPE
jgi:hypothetical protein